MGDRVAVLKAGELQQATRRRRSTTARQPLRGGLHRLAVDEHRRGQLVEEDGNLYVELERGETRLRVQDAAWTGTRGSGSATGRRSRSGCVPEHFTRARRGAGPDQVWKGREIALVEMLGAEMLVHFQTGAPPIVSEDMRAAIDDDEAFEELQRQAAEGGQEFVARFEPGAPPKVGDRRSTTASRPSTCTSSTPTPAARCADRAAAPRRRRGRRSSVGIPARPSTRRVGRTAPVWGQHRPPTKATGENDRGTFDDKPVAPGRRRDSAGARRRRVRTATATIRSRETATATATATRRRRRRARHAHGPARDDRRHRRRRAARRLRPVQRGDRDRRSASRARRTSSSWPAAGSRVATRPTSCCTRSRA
jgi:hypothetical protein